MHVMSVFVNEPLLDWQKNAKRVDAEEAARNPGWFPREKIELARRKLDGDNPWLITAAELEANPHIKPYGFLLVTSSHGYARRYPRVVAALREILRGVRGQNARATAADRCATVSEQVDCLVDQATDPNILGRTYQGWAPWA
jgi:DNA-dependent protein kinase catalytic subunit